MDLNEARQKMEKALEALINDLSALRTGQASPGLIEQIMIEAYETRMPLVELATITTSGPDQLLVSPFDQAIIKNIEKALTMERNLGLSVHTEENIIRIQIPPLSEERRREFTKILHQKLEAGRIMIRQIRHEAMGSVEQDFNAKQLSEEEKFRSQQDLQKLTDEFNEKIGDLGLKKEKELMAI